MVHGAPATRFDTLIANRGRPVGIILVLSRPVHGTRYASHRLSRTGLLTRLRRCIYAHIQSLSYGRYTGISDAWMKIALPTLIYYPPPVFIQYKHPISTYLLQPILTRGSRPR